MKVCFFFSQKLSELDKIPQSFKDKGIHFGCSESYPSPCFKAYDVSSLNSRKQESSEMLKDLKDLNIDKDISYVNKLLSDVSLFQDNYVKSTEVPNFVPSSNVVSDLLPSMPGTSTSFRNISCDSGSRIYSDEPPISNTNSGIDLNFSSKLNTIPEVLICPVKSTTPLKNLQINNKVSLLEVNGLSENSSIVTREDKLISKRPHDFLNTSFNTSDILDLEDMRSGNVNNYTQSSCNKRPDINLNYCVELISNDKDEKSRSDSESDQSQNNRRSITDQNHSEYRSFSPQLSIGNDTKSGSSALPSECLQECSGTGPCIFNNPQYFNEVRSTGETRNASYIGSVKSKFNANDREFLSEFKKPHSVQLAGEIFSDESERIDNISKDIETVSGQSSICTDDQSMCEPSRGADFHRNLSVSFIFDIKFIPLHFFANRTMVNCWCIFL